MIHTAKRAYYGRNKTTFDIMVVVNAEIPGPDETIYSADSAASIVVARSEGRVLIQRVELFTVCVCSFEAVSISISSRFVDSG